MKSIAGFNLSRRRLSAVRRMLPCAGLSALLCAGLCALVLTGRQSHGSAPTVIAHGAAMFALGQQEIDPAKVMGHQSCQECHQSEVASWLQSSHAKKSFSMLTENPKAAQFAQKMSVNALSGDSLCTSCHGTQRVEAGAAKVSDGVSCESCHGAAGPKGPGGWFTAHSDYGDGIKDRTQETKAHREERIKLVKQSGANLSEDIYELAKNCYQCHSVPNERLVNTAGHPSLNAQFEFVSWAHGEVRHNFQLDQNKNADAATLWLDPQWHGAGRTAAARKRQMYVVGQLVDVEIGLRNRASATALGAFSRAAAGRVGLANGKLQRINAAAPTEEVKAAIAEVAKVLPKLFLPPAASQKELFEGAADKVAEAARQFAARHDGSQLAALDAQIPPQVRGTVLRQ